VQLRPRQNKLFTEDPTYPAVSPWAASLIGEITKAEQMLSRAGKDGNLPVPASDLICAFAIADDPYDGNTYVFTKSRGGASAPHTCRVAPSTEFGLVRVCSVAVNQIDFDFLRETVLPKIRAVKSDEPPFIRTNRAEMTAVGNPGQLLKTSLLNTAATASAVLVAAGTGYVLGGSGASEIAAAAGLSGGMATLTYIGFKTFSDVAAGWWTRPTKQLHRIENDGTGVFGLSGGKLTRVSGQRTPGETAEVAIDPVERFFEGAGTRRAEFDDAKTHLSPTKQRI